MNWLDFYTKLYYKERNIPGLPFWVMSPFRIITKIVANKCIPRYLSSHNYDKKKIDSDVVVSFTSFPARINNVWQVVECMMRQTYKPSKILLWLSKEQFPTEDTVPDSLRERVGDCFEIRMVDGNIRSHKKYYYAFKEFKNSLVFLIDDDIYYPTDIIERSLCEMEKTKAQVVANYGYLITRRGETEIKPYREWKRENHYSSSPDIFFGSGGGTLVDVSKMCPMTLDIDLAQKLTPFADDIWLNAMVRLSGLRISLLPNGDVLPVFCKNDVKLASENLWNNENDIQLNNLSTFLRNELAVDIFSCRK